MLLTLLLTVAGLSSCTGGGGPRRWHSPLGGSAVPGYPAPPEKEMLTRPGRNGELKPLPASAVAMQGAHLVRTPFIRASSEPACTDVIYRYAPEDISTGRMERSRGSRQTKSGLVEWGLKGRFAYLNTYRQAGYAGPFTVVSGSEGQGYSIVVVNRSKSTLEIVASVDGLDVLDGQKASASKRGYLVDPGATLRIKGFRNKDGTLSAFRFSSGRNDRGIVTLLVFTPKAA
jgi:hypothetical protein